MSLLLTFVFSSNFKFETEPFHNVLQNNRGVARIFQRGGEGSQRLLTRLYMVYTAALPHVSAGSVVLSRHEGPY